MTHTHTHTERMYLRPGPFLSRESTIDCEQRLRVCVCVVVVRVKKGLLGFVKTGACVV